MIICTTATLSLMPCVMELGRSIRQRIPYAKIVLGLVENSVPDEVRNSAWVDEVILAKDLSIPNFDRFIFKLTEPLSKNTIKAQLLHQLINNDAQADVVIYVDCFSKFLGPIPEVLDRLNHHSIVLTPHLIDAHYSDAYERELSLLNDGTFNSGFIAVKQDDEAKDFLDWWSDKLNRDIRDPYASNFFDQKWLNFVNIFYNAAILRHPGYQLGFWNFHEESRRIVSNHDHEVHLKGGPLRLMSFANENNMFNHYSNLLPEHQTKEIGRLKSLYDANLNTDTHSRDVTWSYGRYHNGETISIDARHKFRDLSSNIAPSNPFKCSNKMLMEI